MIDGLIDGSRRSTLSGSLPSAVRRSNDIGPADPALPVENATILFKPSPEQQMSLDRLLAAQQEPGSPDYHRWLTPEEYADRFGLSQPDLAKISAWLQTEGFHLEPPARGRNWLAFSGTAAQAQSAFQVEIRRYRVDGETHFSNTASPSIPAAFSGIVSAVQGLDDFRMKPSARLKPNFNNANGGHNLAPDDIATIYGVSSLYGSGINGNGQKIVVVGQTNLIATAAGTFPDLDAFRAHYNLPPNTPQLVLTGADPGVVGGDIDEANLDIEWTGAIARNSTIVFVYAKNVLSAVRYAIDQNFAPVISFSYGDCEQRGGISYQTVAQQANAQGITWVASSGDSGAAACDNQSSDIRAATQGLSVSFPASLPEVTGIGGTTLSEGAGSYWSATNSSTNGSALSYIPEVAWNDSPSLGILQGTGGGASILFAKPVWQVGPGVPGDGARDVPDVSLASSPQHDGYQVYTNGKLAVFGGTSIATPIFAGILGLLNQSLAARGSIAQPGLGNINPMLYRLANSTTGIFHDVTLGNNIVPCQTGTANCSTGSYGYSAGPGYDLVTGLGSINAGALINQWTIPATAPSNIVISVSPNPVYQTLASSGRAQWTLAITLTETGGGPTALTGFTLGGTDFTSQIVSFFKFSTVQALDALTGTIAISGLTAPQTFPLTFNGKDPSGRTWSQTIQVQFAGATPPAPQITGLTNSASFQQNYAPGMILSVFGTQLANAAQAAASLPLPGTMQNASVRINGVFAPLYYVSASQLNVQVPYETQPGTATLTLTNNGQTATANFTVTPNAPGIFAGNGNVLVPFASGNPGDTLLLFMTGDGQLSPLLADGSTPSANTPFTQLPAPIAPVTLTVGGRPAAIAFVGVPSGLTGATQVNFLVPSGLAPGTYPVVVTVGGVPSAGVNLTVK